MKSIGKFLFEAKVKFTSLSCCFQTIVNNHLKSKDVSDIVARYANYGTNQQIEHFAKLLKENEVDMTADIDAIIEIKGRENEHEDLRKVTFLYLAIRHKFENIATALIETGVNVNIKHIVPGMTKSPIIEALLQDNTELSKLLIEKGATRPTLQDNNSRRSLQYITATYDQCKAAIDNEKATVSPTPSVRFG